MSNFTIDLEHMTPGAINDCSVKGCAGIVGGVCMSITHPVGDPITSWCCPPKAVQCWGPALFICEIPSDNQLKCTGDNDTKWCCQKKYEACPTSDSLQGSCVPLDWRNPAIDGPIWAPDRSGGLAVSSSITPSLLSSSSSSSSSPSSSTSTLASTSTSAPTLTSTPMSTSGASAESGASHPSLAIVAALGAGGVVLLIAIIAGIYLVWRRSMRSMQKDPRPPPPYPVDMLSGFFTKRTSLEKAPIEMAANEVPPSLQKSHELDAEMPAIKC